MASVPRVAASNVQGAIEALEKAGAVILTGFTTDNHVDQANKDLKLHTKVVADQPIDFYPDKVHSCFAIYGKCKTIREEWALHPTFQAISKDFLRTYSTPWQGQKTETIMSEPILSTSISVNILPGASAQLLHRDDMAWQQHLPDRSRGYTRDLELCVALIIPGTDFFKENGGTQVVPGSHLWPHARRATPDETVCANMKKGDAMVILGSVAHGGGDNTSNEERIMHAVFTCRGYLRPESNIFPVFSRDEVLGWSQAAQELAGYKRGELFMGHADGKDALDVIQNFAVRVPT